MNPNKALWELGEGRLHPHRRNHARQWRGVRRATLGIENGLKVLDLGCCDGTTALPAVKLGANVLGVDIARNLSRRGTAVRRSRAPHP
jgi:cyclopropane fatty-acyl-phospholipid synthase-like methyltransferase